jgi:hypothetical protein
MGMADCGGSILDNCLGAFWRVFGFFPWYGHEKYCLGDKQLNMLWT